MMHPNNKNTGDFTNVTQQANAPPPYSANAPSTTKRKCLRRKIIEIAPLQLNELLSEADNEPHWQPKSPVLETIDETNKENEANRPAPLCDSFDLNFAALTLTTPAKKQAPIKDGDFATPQNDFHVYRRMGKPPDKTNELQYATPKNQAPPKIQCSVKMQNYLKTPIDKLCHSHHTVNPGAEQFRRIHVNNAEYLLLNELGKGGSSEVFQCFNVETKTIRAIKCVSLQNPASAPGFVNEVELLQKLQRCNRIIKLFDYEINEAAATLLVVLELGGADLSKILKEMTLGTDHMPMYMLMYYWMEMLYAVGQIHANGIVHSDLKPANFIKAEGYLKLIDFGIASCIQSDMTSVIKAVPEGSFNYISPEALHNESEGKTESSPMGTAKYKITYKSDVWSLGCILYQLVYRRTPFHHIKQLWAKLSMILDPEHVIEYPEARWVPQKIINTIKRCLQYNVKLRPSVDELIKEYEEVYHNL